MFCLFKQYLVFLLLLFTTVSDVLAIGWEVHPSIGVEISHTDNVYLSQDKQTDTISRLSPAIRLTGDGNRVSLNLDYTLNATNYAEHTSGDELTNSLNSNANIRFIDDFLFMDLSAGIDQRSISNSASTDQQRLAITEDYSEVVTTQISPYIDTLLGKHVDLTMRYTYTNVTYQENSLNNADSEAGVISASVSKAPNGSRINWSIDYSARDVQYEESDDDARFERVNGVLTLSPSVNWEVITSLGYEINEYETVDAAEDSEGETYGLGLQWRPSSVTHFKIMGQNRYSGDSVTVDLVHQKGRTSYSFSYMEELTVDALAGTEPGVSLESNNIGSVSNEAFLQKRVTLGLSRRFLRSNFSISVQSDEREYQNSNREERTVTANVSWDRRLSSRADLRVVLNWNQADLVDSDREDESLGTRIGMSYRFGRRTTANLDYDNINQTSSESSAEYTRNLLTAGVRIDF